MENMLHYVAGDFEGYFYTHQKTPLSQTEKTPSGGLHNVHLYKGELKNTKSIESYKPEEHLNRDGLFLHNITNVQLHPGIGSPITDKKIYDFDQIVLKNVEVINSWELNDKTYGILRGQLVGKIKKLSSLTPPPDPSQKNPVIPPPPVGGGTNPAPPPVGGGTNPAPPPIINGRNNKGCLSQIWYILKWLLLLLLIFFLYKACIKNNAYDFCCTNADLYKGQNDSLKVIIDSLNREIRINDSIIKINEEERIQEEINNIAEQIYFYQGRDVIRDYSIFQLDNLISILKKYPDLTLDIYGHVNGSSDIPDLDLKRAETVKNLLIDKGISQERLFTIGMGGTDPIDDVENKIGYDPWGNTYNRNMRVEIKIRK
jgi:outer membrane protein OmpA-like peptidoglycan-associated protein